MSLSRKMSTSSSSYPADSLVVLNLVSLVFITPIVTFYLLRDWNWIVGRLDDLMPRRWLGRVRAMTAEIDGVLAEFVRGQLSVMGVLAVYYVVGLWLAGLQHALSIGILTGLLVFIPYVGFGLGFAITDDVAKTMVPGSKGEFYWGGMFSTAFFVDPVDDMFAIFMVHSGHVSRGRRSVSPRLFVPDMRHSYLVQ